MNGGEPQNATSILGPNHFADEGNTRVMYEIWHDPIQTGTGILLLIVRIVSSGNVSFSDCKCQRLQTTEPVWIYCRFRPKTSWGSSGEAAEAAGGWWLI